MQWYRDRLLWVTITFGFLIRVVPLAIWPRDRCVRDECTYARLAERIVDGEGMTSSVGWLWAPGYPYLLAAFKWATGQASAVKGLQVLVAVLMTVLVYRMARQIAAEWGSERTQRAGRIAAALYALSPHMAFFSIRLWSEVVYGAILLGAIALAQWARDPGQTRSKAVLAALGCGALVGACVLSRGVATYMVPLFMVALVWGAWRRLLPWALAAIMGCTVALSVAPYSVYASAKFEATVISDRTLGQMMWLGNNDFEPITFDYGNGQLSKRAFNRARDQGRPPCGSRNDAMDRDACQTKEGFAWILANKAEFVKRMPLRVAQLLNPNSLMTRHLRWGRWGGMPQWLDEVLIAWQAAWGVLILLGAGASIAARARGTRGVVIALILLYHCAAIAALAGLSRYRVPLEPLLMIYLAPALADPARTRDIFEKHPLRRWSAVALTLVLAPLVLWYLPAGWWWWRSW